MRRKHGSKPLKPALGVFGEKGLDPLQLVFAEAKLGGADYAVYLIRSPAPDDGRSNGPVSQRSGDGDLAGGPVVLGPDLLKYLHEPQVAREPRFLEVAGTPTPVV